MSRDESRIEESLRLACADIVILEKELKEKDAEISALKAQLCKVLGENQELSIEYNNMKARMETIHRFVSSGGR